MYNDRLTKFERFFIKDSRKFKFIYGTILMLALPLVYFLVLSTGGLKYSYSHTMYIPIVFAGLSLGKAWGVIFGITAGILLGPLMPLDTNTLEQQLFINWFFRLLVFVFIGLLSGFFASIFKKDLKKIVSLYSTNPETMIPNTNALSLIPLEQDSYEQYLLTTIMINNHRIIIELLDNESYFEIVKEIYNRLTNNIQNPLIILQGGSNRLWIARKLDDFDAEMRNIIKILKEPMSYVGIPLYLDFSIGTTVVNGVKKAIEISSFRQSDTAARIARQSGKPFELFKPDYSLRRDEYELLCTFESALLENQTFLVYQPKINLMTNKPEGFEALIRWDHPNRGILSPDKFIPSVEQTKLINNLTDWVLNKVGQKIIEFRDQGIDINISINISVKNLSNPKFFENVMRILNKYKINPNQLELEVTESMLMDNPNENIALLKEFLNKGVITSIDDFGVGYSSLQYLARLPIKIVKIDRYFIRQMAIEQSIKSIVEATIKMSHNLGYEVVAEGIEDGDILDIAKSLKCDYGQGFHFSRPMEANKIIEWYKENI